MQYDISEFHEGMTGLHEAVDGGHTEVCKFLVSIGAKLTVKDDEGLTPLELALELKNEPVIQVLSHLQHKKKRHLRQTAIIAEDKIVQTPLRGRGLPPMVGVDRHHEGELIDL